jgi:hypothetical protein
MIEAKQCSGCKISLRKLLLFHLASTDLYRLATVRLHYPLIKLGRPQLMVSFQLVHLVNFTPPTLKEKVVFRTRVPRYTLRTEISFRTFKYVDRQSILVTDIDMRRSWPLHQNLAALGALLSSHIHGNPANRPAPLFS